MPRQFKSLANYFSIVARISASITITIEHVTDCNNLLTEKHLPRIPSTPPPPYFKPMFCCFGYHCFGETFLTINLIYASLNSVLCSPLSLLSSREMQIHPVQSLLATEVLRSKPQQKTLEEVSVF